MKRFLYPELERLFSRLAMWCERAAWHFAICPECGENRYTGAPCKRSDPQ